MPSQNIWLVIQKEDYAEYGCRVCGAFPTEEMAKEVARELQITESFSASYFVRKCPMYHRIPVKELKEGLRAYPL